MKLALLRAWKIQQTGQTVSSLSRKTFAQFIYCCCRLMEHDVQRKPSVVLFSGAFAALLSTIITNPIEVAKYNVQYMAKACPNYPHQSFGEIIQCTCQKMNLANAFKGLSVAIPQVILSNMIWMQLYETQRKYFLKENIFGSTASSFVASITSRLVVSSTMIHFESERVKASNSIARKSLGGSKGLKITLVRDLIYSGLFWGLLENIRNRWAGVEYRETLHKRSNYSLMLANLLPGLLVGMFVSAVTTPLDTVKTRVQSLNKANYTVLGELKDIYRREGNLGLFAGVHFRIIKNSLHSTMFLILYEQNIKLLSSFRM